MAMPAEEIKHLIQSALPDAQIVIKDLAGDNDHFAAYITSKAFQGKTRVQQHQMIYNALGGKMGNQLHALSIHTLVPQEENS